MADDLTAPAPGAVLKTREIGGKHYPESILADRAGADVIGLVADTPAAFSLLGRLKAVFTVLSDRLPTLGAKAGSGSISIVPATDAGLATAAAQATIAAALTELLARAKARYTLASNVTLAANSGGTPIADVYTGSYIWTAVTSAASVALQVLGPDGTTWQTVETINSGGAPKGVVLPEGASIRLFNPTGGSATVSGKLG